MVLAPVPVIVIVPVTKEPVGEQLEIARIPVVALHQGKARPVGFLTLISVLPLKAELPIELTVFGNNRDVIELPILKALLPILVTFWGKVNVPVMILFWKALSPIVIN